MNTFLDKKEETRRGWGGQVARQCMPLQVSGGVIAVEESISMAGFVAAQAGTPRRYASYGRAAMAGRAVLRTSGTNEANSDPDGGCEPSSTGGPAQVLPVMASHAAQVHRVRT